MSSWINTICYVCSPQDNLTSEVEDIVVDLIALESVPWNVTNNISQGKQ